MKFFLAIPFLVCLGSSALAQSYQAVDYDAVNIMYHPGRGDEVGRFANVGDVAAGLRFGDFYGAELGLLDGGSQNLELRGATLDGMGYLPFGRGSRFSLFSTIGATYLEASVYGGLVHRSEFGARAGGGMEYRITNDLDFRLMARYQTANFDGASEGMIVGTFGLVWRD